MRGRTTSGSPERGFTLIELLITISLLGIGVVAVFVGLATFFKATNVHRANSDLDYAVRSYAESLQLQASTNYVPCASNYSVSALPGFSVTSQTVKYWTGRNVDAAPPNEMFASSCSGDKGVQQIQFTMTKTAGGATQTVTVTKRQP